MIFRMLVDFVTQTKEKFQKSKLSTFQLLQNGGGVKNENSSPLVQTQSNFLYIFGGPSEGLYTYSWAPKRLEMQKLTTHIRGKGQK